MNFKRFTSVGLALAMAATIAPAALADDITIDGVNLPANAGNGIAVPISDTSSIKAVNVDLPELYATQLYLNGEPVEIPTKPVVPGAPADMVPMRVLCEADDGYASWFEEDNQGYFYLADRRFIVNFSDMSVELEGELLEGVSAYLSKGVTFLPAEVLNMVEGVSVELSEDRVDISTPNGTPIVKLAKALLETADMGMTSKTTLEDMEMIYGEQIGFSADMVTEAVFYLPMITSPDTLMIGKIAEGQEEALAEVLESYRQNQESTFEWYLSDNLPKVQNAQFVTEGDWFMFLIAENTEDTIEQFKTAIAEMDAE